MFRLVSTTTHIVALKARQCSVQLSDLRRHGPLKKGLPGVDASKPSPQGADTKGEPPALHEPDVLLQPLYRAQQDHPWLLRSAIALHGAHGELVKAPGAEPGKGGVEAAVQYMCV